MFMGPKAKLVNTVCPMYTQKLSLTKFESNHSKALPHVSLNSNGGAIPSSENNPNHHNVNTRVNSPWSQKLREHMRSLPNILLLKTM